MLIKAKLVRLMEVLGIYESRKDFIKIIPKNKVGAELGVFQGEFSRVLLEVTQAKELHLVDPWFLLDGKYYGDWTRKYNSGELLSRNKAYEQTKAHVNSMPNSNVVKIHVADDIDWLKKVEDAFLDWVYLDSLHTYDHTKKELELLNDKVKQDGIIVGDDWKTDTSHPHYGMRVAIEEFCASENWEVIKLNVRKEQWCIKRKN